MRLCGSWISLPKRVCTWEGCWRVGILQGTFSIHQKFRLPDPLILEISASRGHSAFVPLLGLCRLPLGPLAIALAVIQPELSRQLRANCNGWILKQEVTSSPPPQEVTHAGSCSPKLAIRSTRLTTGLAAC